MSSRATLPAWAVQRVATVLETERQKGIPRTSAVDLARRTGLSKSLARRCLNQIKTASIPQEARP